MTIIKYWNTFVQNLADFVFLAFKKDQDTVVIQHFNPTSKKTFHSLQKQGLEIDDQWGGPSCPRSACTGSRYFFKKINKDLL